MKPWSLPTNRTPSETEEQQDFVRWFRRTYPGVLIFHIPNGDGRSKAAGLRLKTMGVVAGVPDLFVPEWGLWIEMKDQGGGKTSAEQLAIHAYLRSVSQTVLIPPGSAGAQDMVDAWNIGTPRAAQRAA